MEHAIEPEQPGLLVDFVLDLRPLGTLDHAPKVVLDALSQVHVMPGVHGLAPLRFYRCHLGIHERCATSSGPEPLATYLFDIRIEIVYDLDVRVHSVVRVVADKGSLGSKE